MRIIGLMMARSEDWVIGLSLRAALLYCDEVVVYDHLSDDDTVRVVNTVASEYPDRVAVITDRRPDWDEMDQRQASLDFARGRGADRFVIVDADEVLTANLIPRARGLIESCPRGECLALPMVATYHSTAIRRVDWVWGINSRLTWCFHDHGGLFWGKAPDGYQHHQRAPRGTPPVPALAVNRMSEGGVFHLQYITKRRLEEKAAFYKVMETIRYPGRMTAAELNTKYDWTLREGGSGDPRDTTKDLHHIPDDWWSEYRVRGWMSPQWFRPEAESWQARECRRLLAQYSPDRFRGLELHGVA